MSITESADMVQELRERFGAGPDETLEQACKRYVQANSELHQAPLSEWMAANAIASMGPSGELFAASLLGIKGGPDAG